MYMGINPINFYVIDILVILRHVSPTNKAGEDT